MLTKFCGLGKERNRRLVQNSCLFQLVMHLRRWVQVQKLQHFLVRKWCPQHQMALRQKHRGGETVVISSQVIQKQAAEQTLSEGWPCVIGFGLQ